VGVLDVQEQSCRDQRRIKLRQEAKRPAWESFTIST
jgi:hypothetical protein